MTPFNPGVPLSVWLEAVRSELHQVIAGDRCLILNQQDALRFTAMLADMAAESRLLEARAESAPPLDAAANVVAFKPRQHAAQAKAPTGDGAA